MCSKTKNNSNLLAENNASKKGEGNIFKTHKLENDYNGNLDPAKTSFKKVAK